MATLFRPGNALARVAWEADEGHVDSASTVVFHDFRIRGIAGGDEAPTVDPETLESGGQRSQGLPSIIRSSRELPVAWETSGLGFFIASMQQASKTPTVLTGGQSFQHKLAPSETDVIFKQTQSVRLWRDTPFAQIMTGVKVDTLVIDASTEAVISGTVSLKARQSSYWDLATVILEGGTPTRPVLRGLPRYAELSIADHDVFIKVTNTTGPVIDVKVGSAAAYAAIALTVVPGTPLTLTDEAGVLIGEVDNPVELFIPIGASGYTLNDEWEFKSRQTSAPWTPSLPALRALNTIHAVSSIGPIGGPLVPVRLNNFVVTVASPLDEDFHLGDVYTPGLAELANREVSITIDRRHIDTLLEERLVSKEPFELQIIIDSRTVIGSSTDLYTMQIDCKFCIFEGVTANPTAPGSFPEPLTIMCYPSSTDATFPDDITFTINNDIADMTL